MGWRRLLFCYVLGWHIGDIRAVYVPAEEYDLTLHYIPCPRCGDLVPMGLKPRHETEALLEGASSDEAR